MYNKCIYSPELDVDAYVNVDIDWADYLNIDVEKVMKMTDNVVLARACENMQSK